MPVQGKRKYPNLEDANVFDENEGENYEEPSLLPPQKAPFSQNSNTKNPPAKNRNPTPVAEEDDLQEEEEDEDIDQAPPRTKKKHMANKKNSLMKSKGFSKDSRRRMQDEEEQGDEEEEEEDTRAGGGQERPGSTSSKYCGINRTYFFVIAVFVFIMITSLVVMVLVEEPIKGYMSGIASFVFFVLMIYLCCIGCGRKRQVANNNVTYHNHYHYAPPRGKL